VEEERLQEYHARDYSWPLPELLPNTPGWNRAIRRRLSQVERIPNDNHRYNSWVSVITSAVVSPNFTENGWGLTRAPVDLVEELRQSLHNGLKKGPRNEKIIEVIEVDEETRPLFIDQPRLDKKVLRELQPMHEKWSGVSLKGAIAYGLRVYRNNSVLLMHVDKPNTHIISCILHVDHSEDSEPWPIVIEDFQGNTNEVVLESGDMLFYESSKCIHGRPRAFNGSWYSSIFVHYYPTDWDRYNRHLESHYAVPKHWHRQLPPQEGLEDLVMVGTSMKEPGCKDLWCSLENSVKWRGPAPDGGSVVTTGWDPTTMTPPKVDESPLDEELAEL